MRSRRGLWSASVALMLVTVVGPLPSSGALDAEITIDFDLRRPDGSQAVTVGPVLADGITYQMTIAGTYSIWTSEWSAGTCKGTPESAPMFPSPGGTNGKVGVDAEYWFAIPKGSSLCGGSFPVPNHTSGLKVSLDGGSTYNHVEYEGRDKTPGADVPRADHTYTYRVVGQGRPIAFSREDSPTQDNYGILRIALKPFGSVSFDWSVPKRFGLDDDGDGMVDYFPPDGDLEIDPPKGWQVDLVQNQEPCDPSATRRWYIDDVEVGSVDPRVEQYDPHGCTLSYRFPDEGAYDVRLELEDAGGDVVAISPTQEVLVQDWLIVSLGDSVASGEGNPDVAGSISLPRWQSRQCHRSAWAGPARAAIAIEDGDPKTSVTFIHLACSGATITEGIIGPYVGQEPGAPLNPQATEMHNLVSGREIDAALISIGANDIRFSTIVEICFLQDGCHRDVIGLAAVLFEALLGQLAGRYDELASFIAETIQDPDRIYITEYFDPTHDDGGAYCDGTILKEPGSPLALLPFEVSAEEAAWASETMLTFLNAEVAAAANRHDWNFVGGIYGPFAPHGYCAQDRWVVQISESLAGQLNKDGTLHPNRPGHDHYGKRLTPRLRADFYPDGKARRPQG